MPIEVLAAEQLSQRRKKIRRRAGQKIGELDPDNCTSFASRSRSRRNASEFFGSLYGQEGVEALRKIPLFAEAITELPRRVQRHHDAQNVMRGHPRASGAKPDGRAESTSRVCRGTDHGRSAGANCRLLERAGKAHSRFDDAKPFWK